MDNDKQDLPYWLALYFTPGIGPVHFQLLHQYFPQLNQLFNLPEQQLRQLGLAQTTVKHLMRPNWDRVEAHLAWAKQPNHEILSLNSANYPPQLRQISSPPPILFVKGNSKYLSDKQLAVVGSRRPSPQGKQTAIKFTKEITLNAMLVTSGLALGIDAVAHQTALELGAPTIAVLGTGIDVIYPAQHRQLAEKIVRQGALLSEFPLAEQPRRQHFPRRNRIISGLSLGVLVVEAAIRSGSLITARYALEQNREVFAIPGSIHNPMAKGCHQLIKQGAKLVETGADLWQELGVEQQQVVDFTEERPKQLVNHCAKVLQYVDFAPTTMAAIVQQSQLTMQQVSTMLLELELQGYIISEHGFYYRLR